MTGVVHSGRPTGLGWPPPTARPTPSPTFGHSSPGAPGAETRQVTLDWLISDALLTIPGTHMASIHKEIQVRQTRDVVWDAIRDVGAIHKRLVPGFVTNCRLEGDARYLTFGNGMTIREIIVDVDDLHYRHAWSARGEPLTHHNASIQVFAEGESACRLVWIADVMPHEVAGAIAEMIEHGLKTMKATLEG